MENFVKRVLTDDGLDRRENGKEIVMCNIQGYDVVYGEFTATIQPHEEMTEEKRLENRRKVDTVEERGYYHNITFEEAKKLVMKYYRTQYEFNISRIKELKDYDDYCNNYCF